MTEPGGPQVGCLTGGQEFWLVDGYGRRCGVGISPLAGESHAKDLEHDLRAAELRVRIPRVDEAPSMLVVMGLLRDIRRGLG